MRKLSNPHAQNQHKAYKHEHSNPHAQNDQHKTYNHEPSNPHAQNKHKAYTLELSNPHVQNDLVYLAKSPSPSNYRNPLSFFIQKLAWPKKKKQLVHPELWMWHF